MKVIPSLIAIIACGGAGAWLGWEAVTLLAWAGVGAALTAMTIGVIVATALFAAVVVARRAWRVTR